MDDRTPEEIIKENNILLARIYFLEGNMKWAAEVCRQYGLDELGSTLDKAAESIDDAEL